MTRIQRIFATLLFSVFFAGCATITTNIDYDPAADFEAVKSYRWATEKNALTGDPRIDNDLLDKRVRRAVEAGLAAKGYQKADGDASDILIGYHAAVTTNLAVANINDRYGYGPGWSQSYVSAEKYDEGTLILDIVDASSKGLVWRASARATVEPDRTPEEREKLIQEAVTKMLAQFPPPKK